MYHTTEELLEFINGYYECAIRSSKVPLPDSGKIIELDLDNRRIDASLNLKMIQDCSLFFTENYDDLNTCAFDLKRDFHTLGHDFWLTRNRPSTYSWEHNNGLVWERLFEASKKFGTAELYIGSDNEIYHKQ